MRLTANALKKSSGFTLVELIVVITILAILATIGFISYQGYTSDARNTKRKSDLGSINSAISVKRAQAAISLGSFVNPDSTKSLTGTEIIAGKSVTALGSANYNAGGVKGILLGIKDTDFADPTSSTPYVMGWTAKKNGSYQLAASLEGDSPKAMVAGPYAKRTMADTFAAGTKVATTGADGVFRVSPDKGAILAVGDTLSGSIFITGWTLAEIKAISLDMTTITLSGVEVQNGNLSLAEGNEASSLIASGSVVVTDGGTNLPY